MEKPASIPLEIQDDLIQFTRDLVRIQSYSGREEEIIRFIAEKMGALGFDQVRIDSMGNVLGRMGEGQHSILFDSHVDTVTVNDAEHWLAPPFAAEIIGDRLVGRGSVDMKSGAAASIYAAALAKRLGLLAGKTVYVSCTVLEEDCDGENLRHLFQEFNLRPHVAIICEPSNNQIVLGHKGKAQVAIHTRGVSAHGAAPEKGLNAVYAMAEIIQRIEQRNLQLQSQPAPHGTLVLSRISSSSASLNAVPSECEVYLDRRIAPGETVEMVQTEMNELIRGKPASWQVDRIARQSWTGLPVSYEPLHPAWRIEQDHPLTLACIDAYAQQFGGTPPVFGFWDFSTNAVATTRLGIPTIGFGPGDSKQAHMRDESLEIGQIVDSCGFYIHLIETIKQI